MAKGPNITLQIGDPAPGFEAPANGGGSVSLKQFMGRTSQGVHRSSFLIGADGRIRAIWPAVKPAEHPTEVLAAIRAD